MCREKINKGCKNNNAQVSLPRDALNTVYETALKISSLQVDATLTQIICSSPAPPPILNISTHSPPDEDSCSGQKGLLCIFTGGGHVVANPGSLWARRKWNFIYSTPLHSPAKEIVNQTKWYKLLDLPMSFIKPKNNCVQVNEACTHATFQLKIALEVDISPTWEILQVSVLCLPFLRVKLLVALCVHENLNWRKCLGYGEGLNIPAPKHCSLELIHSVADFKFAF